MVGARCFARRPEPRREYLALVLRALSDDPDINPDSNSEKGSAFAIAKITITRRECQGSPTPTKEALRGVKKE